MLEQRPSKQNKEHHELGKTRNTEIKKKNNKWKNLHKCNALYFTKCFMNDTLDIISKSQKARGNVLCI